MSIPLVMIFVLIRYFPITKNSFSPVPLFYLQAVLASDRPSVYKSE